MGDRSEPSDRGQDDGDRDGRGDPPYRDVPHVGTGLEQVDRGRDPSQCGGLMDQAPGASREAPTGEGGDLDGDERP